MSNNLDIIDSVFLDARYWILDSEVLPYASQLETRNPKLVTHDSRLMICDLRLTSDNDFLVSRLISCFSHLSFRHVY